MGWLCWDNTPLLSLYVWMCCQPLSNNLGSNKLFLLNNATDCYSQYYPEEIMGASMELRPAGRCHDGRWQGACAVVHMSSTCWILLSPFSWMMAVEWRWWPVCNQWTFIGHFIAEKVSFSYLKASCKSVLMCSVIVFGMCFKCDLRPNAAEYIALFDDTSLDED